MNPAANFAGLVAMLLLISAASADEMPRLFRTVLVPGARIALLQPQGSDTPIYVREGDRIGTFLVSKITYEGVILKGAMGMRMLKPAFASSAVHEPLAEPPSQLEMHTQGGDQRPE